MTRPHYETAIQALGIMEALAAYDPHIAGTPPLGVHTEKSDIDILCHATDQQSFLRDVVNLYGDRKAFCVWQWTSNDQPIIASFTAEGWDFEIFTSRIPVVAQAGWRHFQIEKRLLALGGNAFKSKILALRSEGLKTEPAFWSALQSAGDPYLGLLDLEAASDEELRGRLAEAGFVCRLDMEPAAKALRST